MNKLEKLFLAYPKWSAILLGAIFPLGFAPFNWVLPSLISIAGMYLIWQSQAPKSAKVSGFLFGFSAFLVGANWILTSVGVFGGAPMWLAVLVMLGLHCIMGTYFALLGFVSAKYLPKLFSESGNTRSSYLSSLFALGSFAAIWVLIEWLRSWVLSGFPWLNVGYLSVTNPVNGFVPLGGVHTASFVFVVCALAGLLMLKGQKRTALLSSLLIGTLLLSGFVLNKIEWTQAYSKPLDVALIQGGVPQDKKWQPEQLPKTMNIYTNLSYQNADADLIIWPEAAIPNLRAQSFEFYKMVQEKLGQDTGFLMSSLIRFPKKTNGADDIRNGLFMVDDKFGQAQEQAYFKQHLVPYGEYFPVPDLVENWLRRMNLMYGDITPGKRKQKPLHWNGYQFGAFICYEDAYPNVVRDMLPAANVLVNVTNDAWFSGSLAPHQHLQITQTRALEMARPILRATNDGVTALIDYRGKIISTVPQYKPEVLRGMVQARSGSTPYIKFGNWPIISFCFFILGLMLLKYRA